MGTNDKKIQYAERLYIENGYTGKDIAQTIGATEKTIGAWKVRFKWEEKKLLNDTAPNELKILLLKEAKSIAEGNDPRFNTDALSKVMKSYERLDKSLNTQSVISVFKEFDNWLLSQDIEQNLIDKSLHLHKQFIQYRIENEG